MLLFTLAVAAMAPTHVTPTVPTIDQMLHSTPDEVFGATDVAPAANGGQSQPVPTPPVPTMDQMLHSTPDEVFGATDAALHRAALAKPPKTPSVDDMVRKALIGGDGMIHTAENDATPLFTAENASQAQGQADWERRLKYTDWDRVKAAMRQTIAAQVYAAINDQHNDFDPAFMARHMGHWEDVEAFAKDDAELADIRKATSDEGLRHIQAQIIVQRQQNDVIDSTGNGTSMRVAANTATILPVLLLLAGVVGWQRRRRTAAK